MDILFCNSVYCCFLQEKITCWQKLILTGNGGPKDRTIVELSKYIIADIIYNQITIKQSIMKKTIFYLSILLLVAFFMQACTSNNMPIAGKNKSLKADFKDIKTYAWISAIDNIPTEKVLIGPNGIFIFNNESGRKMIKDAIEYELSAKGYQMVETNPDMLLSFTVLEQPASLRTTHGYVTVESGEKVRTQDNVSYTDVKPGTLIIDITKNNVNIWQGFVSGILKADEMNNQSKVRNAVSTVFKEFNYSNNK